MSVQFSAIHEIFLPASTVLRNLASLDTVGSAEASHLSGAATLMLVANQTVQSASTTDLDSSNPPSQNAYSGFENWQSQI